MIAPMDSPMPISVRTTENVTVIFRLNSFIVLLLKRPTLLVLGQTPNGRYRLEDADTRPDYDIKARARGANSQL